MPVSVRVKTVVVRSASASRRTVEFLDTCIASAVVTMMGHRRPIVAFNGRPIAQIAATARSPASAAAAVTSQARRVSRSMVVAKRPPISAPAEEKARKRKKRRAH